MVMVTMTIINIQTSHLSVLSFSHEQICEQPRPYWFGGHAGMEHCVPSHPSLQKQRPLICEQVAPLSQEHVSVQFTP